MDEEELRPFPSSSKWDITKEAFKPNGLPQKVTRAWERVPVAAQAPRLHGSTVWKKVQTRKYGTSKNIEAEAIRESEANGAGPRKRMRSEGTRLSILDASWATIPSAQSTQHFEDNLEASATAIAVDFQDIRLAVEEHKGTFPEIHFVPRKRTHYDQVIAPKEVEHNSTKDITEEAQQQIHVEAVHGAEEKPARRRKSARMSMANRRVTLGGPDLGLDSPFKSTPSKGTPSKPRPMRVFESGGDGSGGKLKIEFGANTRARRTTIGITELLTPTKDQAPVRRKSLRAVVIERRKSLSALQSTRPRVLGDWKSVVAPKAKENDAGNADDSPKRKRNSSIQPATRKSSRLSIQDRTSILGGSDADLTAHPEGDPKETSDTSVPDVDVIDISSAIYSSARIQAPDIFGASRVRDEEFNDSEDSERPVHEIPRPSTRRSSREVIQETQSSSSKVNILISIKSIHMANISSGRKTHEFRSYKLPEATEYLWFYETAPKQCLTHVAKIGSAQVPGEIDNKGLGNVEFNVGPQSQYAYEILQLYELKDELSLNTILEKQYAKGPPQKYSFASHKMLNDISLYEDATLLISQKPRTSIETTGEAMSPAKLSDPMKWIEAFSPKASPAKATWDSGDHEEVSTIPHELPMNSTRLDRIEEETVLEEDAEEDGGYMSPEQKAFSRLRSPPPVYEDMLNPRSENSTILLSPNKNEENKLSDLSPIQFGNKLLQEEDPVSSPIEGIQSPRSPALDGSPTVPTETSIDSNPFLSSPHEDTIMLKNFVTRVKANKAAQDTVKSTGEGLYSPLRPPLGYKDSNLSPLPQEFSPSKEAPPVPETPSVPNSKKVGKRSNPLSTPYEGEPPIRRSGRTRTPVKGASSSLPLPISAPSSIPLRRLGANDSSPDTDFASKQKAEKELATLTRFNTKRNAGPHSVAVFLKRQVTGVDPNAANIAANKAAKKKSTFKTLSQGSLDEDSPVQETRQRSTRRKSVMWAEELAQYQEAPSLEDRIVSLVSEGKKPVKVDMRSATASKIAIGMGISGASATSLIPDLALAKNSNVVTALNSIVGGSVASSNITNTTTKTQTEKANTSKPALLQKKKTLPVLTKDAKVKGKQTTTPVKEKEVKAKGKEKEPVSVQKEKEKEKDVKGKGKEKAVPSRSVASRIATPAPKARQNSRIAASKAGAGAGNDTPGSAPAAAPRVGRKVRGKA